MDEREYDFERDLDEVLARVRREGFSAALVLFAVPDPAGGPEDFEAIGVVHGSASLVRQMAENAGWHARCASGEGADA